MSIRRTNEPRPLEVEGSTAGATSAGDLAEVKASMSFGFVAAMFVVLPETWPVFAAFARTQGIDEDFSREHGLRLLDCLALGLNSASELEAE